MRKRSFVPSGKYRAELALIGVPTRVERWEWTASRGLRVHYTNGMACRSDYTLPELLATGEAEEVTRKDPAACNGQTSQRMA